MTRIAIVLVAAGLIATSAAARPQALHLVAVGTFAAPVYAASHLAG